MIQYLKFQDSNFATLEVSEVNSEGTLLISICLDEDIENQIELDMNYTKELVIFLNKQIEDFKNR